MFLCRASFFVFLTKFLSKCPSSTTNPPHPYPEKFLVAYLHEGIVLLAEYSILNVWQSTSVSIAAHWFVQWPYAMYWIRYIQNSGMFSTVCLLLFFFRYMLAHSVVFSDIKAYSRNRDIIKAYLGLFRHIQHPVQPSHIHNLAIFWALAYLEPEAYLKPCEMLTRHIITLPWVNIQPYSGIFRALCNACLCRNLAYYSESSNIQNSSIVASRRLFRTLPYLLKFTSIQNSDIFKIRHIFRTLSTWIVLHLYLKCHSSTGVFQTFS